MKRRKPDWTLYRRDGVYPLHILCALSLDINPDDIDMVEDRNDPDLAEFWARLRAAAHAAETGELPTFPTEDA